MTCSIVVPRLGIRPELPWREYQAPNHGLTENLRRQATLIRVSSPRGSHLSTRTRLNPQPANSNAGHCRPNNQQDRNTVLSTLIRVSSPRSSHLSTKTRLNPWPVNSNAGHRRPNNRQDRNTVPPIKKKKKSMEPQKYMFQMKEQGIKSRDYLTNEEEIGSLSKMI